MFIQHNINTVMYQRQYISVFDLDDTYPHTYVMTTLRKNLEKEMMLKSWNAYDLANKSGVPQPTIQRFLKGKIGDPRADTVRKLANGLGTTEAALRGFNVQLSGVEVPSSPLLDKFNQLCSDQQREVSDFINFQLSQNKEK